MRSLLFCLIICLLATNVFAQNPDGQIGTLWFEAGGGTTAFGKWEQGETDNFQSEADDYKAMQLGGEFGFVATSNISLMFGFSWFNSKAINAVKEYDVYGSVHDMANVTQSGLMLNFRIRIYAVPLQ